MIEEIEKIEHWLRLYRTSKDRVSMSYVRIDTTKYKLVMTPSNREMVLTEELFRLLFISITGKPIVENRSTLSETNGYHTFDWYLAHLHIFTRKLIIDEVLEGL